jgi:hypothetical protein
MIIISYKPGQLANRLFLFAKFIAYGVRHRIQIVNPAFDDYAHYFETTEKQWLPASRGFEGRFSRAFAKTVYQFCVFLGRIVHRLGINLPMLSTVYLDWSEHHDLDNDEKLKKKGAHFIQGWEFDAPMLMTTYRNEIIRFFQPEVSLRSQIESAFNRLNGPGLLMGVHIRHGDYKSFEGGRYFYELDAYKSLMTGLAQNYPDIRFLICTNNKSLNARDFSTYKATMAPGHELVDLYLLARCNYIMGPPSTYSLWASYYGNVPLYQIKDIKKDVGLKDFTPAENE